MNPPTVLPNYLFLIILHHNHTNINGPSHFEIHLDSKIKKIHQVALQWTPDLTLNCLYLIIVKGCCLLGIQCFFKFYFK